MQTSVFSALSDGSRMGIVELLLKENAKTCCEIADEIEKDVSTTFRHLEILERAGIVKTEKKGRQLVCSLKNEKALTELLKLAKKLR